MLDDWFRQNGKTAQFEYNRRIRQAHWFFCKKELREINPRGSEGNQT